MTNPNPANWPSGGPSRKKNQAMRWRLQVRINLWRQPARKTHYWGGCSPQDSADVQLSALGDNVVGLAADRPNFVATNSRALRFNMKVDENDFKIKIEAPKSGCFLLQATN